MQQEEVYGLISMGTVNLAKEVLALRAERAELVEALERAEGTLESFLMPDHPIAISIRALLARIGGK